MRQILRFPFVVFVLLLLAGCGRAPTLPKLAGNDVVVAFGDSLTYGTGASSEAAYPAVLSTLTGHTVVNAGMPGETTGDALARLPQVLDQYHPRLVLLCLGGNDMLHKQPASATERNLRALVKTIQASGASVVLIGVPEPTLFGGAPAFYATIADDLKLPYEGEVFNEVLKDASLKSDPIHANAQGYRRVAERLAALLKSSGAL
jgi:lysophospholipase L1-like esterase